MSSVMQMNIVLNEASGPGTLPARGCPTVSIFVISGAFFCFPFVVFRGLPAPKSSVSRVLTAVVGPICFLDLVCTHKTTVWIKVHTRRLCDAHYADGSLCTALIRARACICAVLCAALITMCFSALNVTWSIIMHFGLEQVRETSLPPGSVRQNSSPSVAMR